MRLTHLLLTAFTLAATIASAQDGIESNLPGAGFDTPATATATPTLKVYSRETIIDVLVTDANGHPVTGLKQSDFTVKEDGKPQPIRSFYEYSKATPHIAPPTLPPNTYTNATKLPTTGPVQIFLFDAQVSQPKDLVRSKQYIAQYLRTMPAGTEVALFELSPIKHLRLLQGFTSNGPLAASIVDKLDPEWVRPPRYITAPIAVPIAIAGLNQIASYVAGVHGLKNLIWIAPRVLMIAKDGGQSWPSPSGPDMTRAHQFMDLYDLFTKEQIAIYPLDPRGVHGLGPVQLMNEEVAEGTGGATNNTNDYKSEITKIVDDSTQGYTLSYVPSRPDPDGHFHPITISVDRPGLHLSYRTGYNDEQPFPPSAALKHDMIQGPMRIGAMPATQILFTVHVQPASPSQPGLTPVADQHPTPHTKGAPYNVVFQLDPTQLAYTQALDGKRTCSLEFDLGAFDAFSQLITARSQTLKITLTSAQYAVFVHKPVDFTLPIDLPHGKLTLRAGVFDTSANKAGTLEIPLTIPKR